MVAHGVLNPATRQIR